MYGMIDDKDIQIAVMIIVEEYGLGVEAFYVETIFMGLFGEGAIVIVDEELVAAVEIFVSAYLGEIDVRPAVIVHVGDGDACFPIAPAFYTGFCGDVVKMKITFVMIEYTSALVGDEIDIGQTVAIEVCDGNAPAIIIIKVVEDIERVGISDPIFEADAGAVCRQQVEEGGRPMVTGGKE
jgi:hypothetical protein